MEGYKIEFKRYDPFGSGKYTIEEAKIIKEYKDYVEAEWNKEIYKINKKLIINIKLI